MLKKMKNHDFIKTGQIIGSKRSNIVDILKDSKLLSPDSYTSTDITIENNKVLSQHTLYDKIEKTHINESIMILEDNYHDTNNKVTTTVQIIYIGGEFYSNKSIVRND
jgi:hypothetical protein